MLAEPTLQRLYSMRLHGMAEAYCRQLEDPSAGELPFEDRFGLLVESQWTWKESRALTRRLQLAKLKQQACLEDINYRHPRGLQATRFKGMAHESAWVRRRQNVLLVGPTGVGKTFLACALLHQACRDGHRALYARAPQLFRDLRTARAEGTLTKMLAKLPRVEALAVDDFALEPMDETACRDFLEVCDDRYLLRSTVLSSQLPVVEFQVGWTRGLRIIRGRQGVWFFRLGRMFRIVSARGMGWGGRERTGRVALVQKGSSLQGRLCGRPRTGGGEVCGWTGWRSQDWLCRSSFQSLACGGRRRRMPGCRRLRSSAARSPAGSAS